MVPFGPALASFPVLAWTGRSGKSKRLASTVQGRNRRGKVTKTGHGRSCCCQLVSPYGPTNAHVCIDISRLNASRYTDNAAQMPVEGPLLRPPLLLRASFSLRDLAYGDNYSDNTANGDGCHGCGKIRTLKEEKGPNSGLNDVVISADSDGECR
jgi:hypothetical protein